MRTKYLVGVTLFCLIAIAAQGQGIITTFAGASHGFNPDGQRATGFFINNSGAVVAFDPTSNSPVFAVTDRNLVLKIGLDGKVVRLAGTGLSGFSGDGASALSANLQLPFAVAYDSKGDAFIADALNNRVRKVTPAGVITTVAGNGQIGYSGDNGPATQASLNLPIAVAVDSAGNLFIVDQGNRVIRRVAPDQTISSYAGNGALPCLPTLDNQAANLVPLCAPTAIAVDSGGNLYIADSFDPRVRKVASGSRIITTFAGTGTAGVPVDGSAAAGAPLAEPSGVAVDGQGNVYIADASNNQIYKVTNGKIALLAGRGSKGLSGDGGPATQALLYSPFGVAVDSQGNVIFSDQNNFRIREIDTTGRISTIAGNGTAFDNGASLQNLFLYLPEGVATAPNGDVYIADTANNLIRRVRSDGTVFTVAGTGVNDYAGDGALATMASLSSPFAVALDPAGDLFIADTGNNVIRRVDNSTGIISTVAGVCSGFCGGGYDGDFKPAVTAKLNGPTGVAVDSQGVLYIADTGNHRIRKVVNGQILTVAGTGNAGFSGDGPAQSASLSGPAAVALDASGNNLYIADANNFAIRKLSGGTLTTIAGRGPTAGRAADNGPATRAQLGTLRGVATDSKGNIYFSDFSDEYVRQVDLSGILHTVAGSGVAGFNGDNGVPTQAALNEPAGLAVDAAGDLFIADVKNNRIRSVTPGAPPFTIDTTSLSFNGFAGGPAAAASTVTLQSSLAGVTYIVSSNLPSWLIVPTASLSGQLPAIVTMQADPSSLSAGTYNTDVVFQTGVTSPPTQTVHVTFVVVAAPAPALALESNQLAFAFPKSAAAQTASLRVLNTGGGSLSFNASAATTNGGPWLSITPGSGAATILAPVSLAITADPAGLNPGTYVGAITLVTNQNPPQTSTVVVNMTVSSTAQTMALSQTGLTFTAVLGGGTPPPQTFAVINQGSGTLNWSATATTPVPPNWITVTPASGASTGGVASPPVTVSVNPSGLTPGVYSAVIVVSSSNAVNSPQLLTVALNLLAATRNPGPVVQPAGLLFTAVAGGQNPAPQTVTVTDLLALPLTLGSSETFVGAAANYFLSNPTNATLQPGSPLTITVTPVIAGLPPGVYQGALSLAFSDGSLRAVAIRLIVAAGVPAQDNIPSSAAASAASCTPTTLVPVFTTLADTFQVPGGASQPINVLVADDCGTPLTQGAVTVSFSNTYPPQEMISLTGGRWNATWTPQGNSSEITLTVRARGTSPALTSPLVSINGGIQDNLGLPVLTPAGVISATNSAAGAPLAPGGFISIYGLNLSAAVGQAAGLPLETSLQSVSVQMGIKNLPLQYVSAGQINAIIPYDLPANTQPPLFLSRGNSFSNVVQISLADSLPSIFITSGLGAITDRFGSLYSASHPAQSGAPAVIYCTGLGTVNNGGDAGSAAPGNPPATTTNMVSVTIGGQPAQFLFSGLAPGFAGLYQINVLVPSGLASGPQPVVVSEAGRLSAPVALMVQ